MSTDIEKGITLTPKTLSALLGTIALAVALYNGVSTVNGYSFRLEKLEAERVQFISSIEKLNTKLDETNSKIFDLTIALNRVEEHLNAQKR